MLSIVSNDAASGLGARVKQAREALGLSQGQLGRKMGLKSRGYISRLEAEKVGKRPSDELVAALVRALNVSREWLVNGDAVPPLIPPFVPGPPRAAPPRRPAERTVEIEDQFPSRAQFLALARAEGADEAILEAVRLYRFAQQPPDEVPVEFWRSVYKQLAQERKAFRRELRAISLDDDDENGEPS